ncbi:MAG: AbrB/MazE/SpoVT family DNA-binding domain-containing protein [Chloroflexi bacterium]|nr:AbrB/MazE/SpoVT family DNA-binding domain-containing protein [Chloroflexota bacterium]
MNIYSKVTRNGQITLPKSVREKLGVYEGDIVEIEIVGENAVLVPQKMIDKSQAYFWTKSWQDGELQAESDIKKGRIKVFTSADNLIKELD